MRVKHRLEGMFEAFDRFQMRHRLVGFPLAVRAKYSRDQGSYLAATIAYYGFFSLFPLLLVLVTGLGYLLQGRAHLQQRILTSALGQFPVIGSALRQHALKGNGVALALGVVASLWTGIGVLLAAESAMNRLWRVPSGRRPGFVASRLRALGLLAVLGGGVVATTGISGAGAAAGSLGIALRLTAILASLIADFFLFWLAYRLLTPAEIGWSCLRGGAAAAALGYEVLQLIGSFYVTRTLRHASNVYGTFGLVIGLLTWIYLTASLLVLAAEGSVVAERRLWPRSLRAVHSREDASGEPSREPAQSAPPPSEPPPSEPPPSEPPPSKPPPSKPPPPALTASRESRTSG
jgi:membrane protein